MDNKLYETALDTKECSTDTTMSLGMTIINFLPLKTKDIIFNTLPPACEFHMKQQVQSLDAEPPVITGQMSGQPGLNQMELYYPHTHREKVIDVHHDPTALQDSGVPSGKD